MQARRINGWGPYIGPMLAALLVVGLSLVQDTPSRTEMKDADRVIRAEVKASEYRSNQRLIRIEGKLDRLLERRAEGN